MKEKLFFRNCPACNVKMGYTTKKECFKAEKNNSFCKKCRKLKLEISKNEKCFFRECYVCGRKVGYTNKKNMNRAKKINRPCASCVSKGVQNRPDIIKRKSLYAIAHSLGELNPFYGRHHTESSKNKIRNNVDRSFSQTKEFREKSARKGIKNGMYGISYYDVWVVKYGEEEANKKLIDLKKRKSIQTSGKNNPMYGRKSPVGSGNGWSGWYKGWYFRSLKELSYMIYVIEKNRYKWISAETKELRIPYIDYNGKDKTYVADFFINNSILVEVKPKQLMGTINNRLKKEAAIKFCKIFGYKYVMVDVKLIEVSILIDLYKNGQVVLIEKYNKKLEKIICKLEKKKK